MKKYKGRIVPTYGSNGLVLQSLKREKDYIYIATRNNEKLITRNSKFVIKK